MLSLRQQLSLGWRFSLIPISLCAAGCMGTLTLSEADVNTTRPHDDEHVWFELRDGSVVEANAMNHLPVKESCPICGNEADPGSDTASCLMKDGVLQTTRPVCAHWDSLSLVGWCIHGRRQGSRDWEPFDGIILHDQVQEVRVGEMSVGATAKTVLIVTGVLAVGVALLALGGPHTF